MKLPSDILGLLFPENNKSIIGGKARLREQRNGYGSVGNSRAGSHAIRSGYFVHRLVNNDPPVHSHISGVVWGGMGTHKAVHEQL